MRTAERAVVREHLEVVEPVPAGLVEGREHARELRDAVARQHAVGPAACLVADVRDVHPGEAAELAADVFQLLGLLG